MPSQAASRRSSSHQTAASSGNHHQGAAVGGIIGEESSSFASLTDDPKYAIASNFFATMLHEVVIDTALSTHRRVTRQRRAEGRIKGGCAICKMSCQASHESSNPNTQKHYEGDDRAIKTEGPEEGEASPSQAQDSGNSAPPKGLEMYQNNPLLACLVCSRQVSANRYAQHLASCVGVGKGGVARRKGKNGAGSSSAKDRIKIKTALENRKRANFQTQSNRNTPTPSARPEQESMSGASDEESGNRKSKSLGDTLGINGNGKRPFSPSESSVSKKGKDGTPVQSDVPGRGNSAQPFAPSALGSSLPVTGSPLNPHRNNKPVQVVDNDNRDEAEGADDDDDDDDEEEEEEEEDEDEEEEEEEEDDDDDDEEEEEDEDTSVALVKGRSRHARAGSIVSGADSYDDDDSASRSDAAASDNASLLSGPAAKRRSPTSGVGAGAIERSKGSDGEYIDVESASAHSEVDDDF